MVEVAIDTPFDDPIPPPEPVVKRPKLKLKTKVKSEKPQYPSISKNEKFSPLPGLPKSPKVKAEFIFNYWKGLSKENQGRCTMYVYRKWPVIDRTKAGGPDAEKNIGKYHEPMDIEEIERIHGSGDYHIILNEQYLYKRTVLYSASPYQVRRDDSPPILNINELDMSDPANASYIERLRLKGVKFPGEEDRDMAANSQAIQELTGTVERLANKVIDQGSRPQISAAPLPEPASRIAEKHVVEMMNDGFKVALGAVKESMGSQQRAADPMETVNAVVKIAQEMAPKPDGSQAVLMKEMMEANRQLTGQIADQNNRRIETLERELQSSRRAVEAVSPTQAPKSFLEQMKEYREFKSVAGDILGTGGDEEDDHKGKRNGSPWWADMIPAAAPMIVSIFTLGANMFYNAAVAKGGPGTAQPPPPVGGLTPEQQAMAQQAGMVPVQQHPYPQQQQEQNQMFNVFAAYHPVLEDLRRPLLECFGNLDSDFPGADFALQIIQFRGRELYDKLKSVGPDTLMGLLESYPPVWGVMSLDRARVQKFLTDFIRYDEIAEQWARETDQPEPEIVPRRVVKIPQA